MNTIKNIFTNQITELTHRDFTKFGKGEYPDRYIIEVKKQKDKTKIKTSFEFANEFVKQCAETIPDNQTTKVKGAIITTEDIKTEIESLGIKIDKLKQFMGVKQFIINSELSKNTLIGITDKFSGTFLALSFSTPSCEIKIKQKSPRSGKPTSKKSEQTPRANFCTLTITNNPQLINNILFDIQNKDYKSITISHKILVDKIIMPEQTLQEKTDFAKVRELAKRKGKLIRTINIDEQTITNETEFIV